MNMQNIFEDEWRACLRAHFFHVIKEQDSGNERSLITVLLQTGFSEDEIAAMRAETVAELGWTPGADPSTEPDYEDELQDAVQTKVQTPVAIETEHVEVAAPAPPADQDEDEPEGPPVQLSLF